MTTALLAIVLSVAAGGAPAAALSCVDPAEWYPEADHVFVGRVADADESWMRFTVEEVWIGPDLGRDMWLRTQRGMETWYPFIEDSGGRGATYVVAVDADLVLSPCGLAGPGDVTRAEVVGAATPRPPLTGPTVSAPGSTAPEIVAGSDAATGTLLGAAGAGLLAGGLLAVVLLRRRRVT